MTDPGEIRPPACQAEQAGGVILSVEEALQFGLKLHNAGLLEEGEILYRRILENFPDHTDALHFLGLICHQRGNHSEAAELMGRVAALLPQNPDALNSLGNALTPLERLAESEDCYRKAIALDPAHAHAHNNLGITLSAQSRFEEAVEEYRRAVELKPDSVDFRCNLGRTLRRADRWEEAVSVFSEAVFLDPDNYVSWLELGLTLRVCDAQGTTPPVLSKLSLLSPRGELAGYMKVACLGEDAPAKAPGAYIQDSFDKMAEGFDKHLLGKLQYRAPDLVAEALASQIPSPSGDLDILDAGCGTGLCGPLLRAYAKSLAGVDLSVKMLEKARERETYDSLIKADLSDFLKSNSSAWDVVVSADTLCYFGALETVFANTFLSLKENGLFIFTLEEAKEATKGWRLNTSARYAHAASYVEKALHEAGFSVLEIRSVILRNEGREPVHGHLATALKEKRLS